MTEVVNIRHDEYDVRIDRRSRWGNPFKIGPDGTREEIIAKHMRYVRSERPDLLERLPELEGKRLGCWCAPLPCHGDNYVKLLGEED
jgi:hypothetical protein